MSCADIRLGMYFPGGSGKVSLPRAHFIEISHELAEER